MPRALLIVVQQNKETNSGSTKRMGWSYSHEPLSIGTSVVLRIRWANGRETGKKSDKVRALTVSSKYLAA